MSEVTFKTYTNGFDFELNNELTKDGMIEVCRALEMHFGDGNVFVPEGITDGFILWADWPGKIDGTAYKCMRHSRSDSGARAWPWVAADAMTTWVGSEEVALAAGKYSTFLKAFNTAPAWTVNELQTIKECLQEKGFRVMRIPLLAKRKRRTQGQR
jgi:hypothetical protein